MRTINWTKKNNTPEKLIEHQIEQYLRMKGFYVQKMQAGSMFVEGRRIKMAEAGTPDILAVKDGKVTFIEVKAPKGKLTLLQEEKMKELEEYGAKCFVARSVEDVVGMGL